MGRLSERLRIRLFLLLAFALVTASAFDFVAPLLTAPARAQEGDNKDSDKVTTKEPSSATPTATGWFGRTVKLITHIIRSVGCFFGFVFGVISVILVALVVLLALELRMGGAIPTGFVEDFTDTVNKRKFKEAYDMAKDDNSYLGRVLATGMSRLQYGIDDAREAAFNMVDSIRAGKEQPITYLATIASLGPLLGLVGTVFGMIQAFMNVAETGQMNAGAIAGDISQALVVTLFGVALAVPAIFCHALFRNRLNKIALETGNVADDLLTQMYHNSKKQGAAPTPAAAPTVVPTVEAVPASPAVRQK
jgi:biopolymer transport protein ExbB